MKKTFKVGQKIQCRQHFSGILTKGKVYTVRGIHKDNLGYTHPVVLRDDGNTDWSNQVNWDILEDAEEEYSIEAMLEKAKSLLGRTIYTTHCRYDIALSDKIEVILRREDAVSLVAREEFDKRGHAVVIKTGCFTLVVNNMSLVPKSKVLKLNDEYNAEVFKDKVIVGCQRIPMDKVREIVKLADELA